ncbi:MAG: diguanylate cyclase [Pseudomonadota bacterium]
MSVTEAQRLRTRRTLWGLTGQGASLFIAFVLVLYGLLPAMLLGLFAVAVALSVSAFLLLIRTGVNLRFTDPSMTAAQIITSLWPAIFMMFFVSDPQARTAFLFVATGALLFGLFALRRREMMAVTVTIVCSYLLLLIALQLWAPQRIDWRAESVIVFAYAVVLVMVTYIGSYIADIRNRLREQNRQLEVLATRDPLTQLPNRRALLGQMSREIRRSERRSPDSTELCISMIDIDHFKDINDEYGHDVGDAVLTQFSEILGESIREGDFVGRFGGEEFVLLLPETTLDAARVATDRVRAAVAAARFAGLPEGVGVTISQGVALHVRGDTLDATIKRADQALYRAKSSGRDRIIVSA